MSLLRTLLPVGGGPVLWCRLLRDSSLSLTLFLGVLPAANAADEAVPPAPEQFIGGLVTFVLILYWILRLGRKPARRSSQRSDWTHIERRVPGFLRRILLWNPGISLRMPHRMSRQRRRAYLRRRR